MYPYMKFVQTGDRDDDLPQLSHALLRRILCPDQSERVGNLRLALEGRRHKGEGGRGTRYCRVAVRPVVNEQLRGVVRPWTRIGGFAGRWLEGWHADDQGRFPTRLLSAIATLAVQQARVEETERSVHCDPETIVAVRLASGMDTSRAERRGGRVGVGGLSGM